MKALWHRLLLFLNVRKDWEWAGPDLGPEVPHPYVQHRTRLCCNYCGGGPKNAIHKPPFDPRRTKEVLEDAVNNLDMAEFRGPTHEGRALEHFPGFCDCLTCWCHQARTDHDLEQSRAAGAAADIRLGRYVEREH